jgi:hypothetical protein
LLLVRHGDGKTTPSGVFDCHQDACQNIAVPVEKSVLRQRETFAAAALFTAVAAVYDRRPSDRTDQWQGANDVSNTMTADDTPSQGDLGR